MLTSPLVDILSTFQADRLFHEVTTGTVTVAMTKAINVTKIKEITAMCISSTSFDVRGHKHQNKQEMGWYSTVNW